MRILHVIASLDARDGGPPRTCLGLCRELVRLGEETAIYTIDAAGKESASLAADFPVAPDGPLVRCFPAQRPRSYRFSRPLAKALKANVQRYDVVHIYSLYLFPPAAAAHYCRCYGVPYIVHPHGTLDPYLYRRHRGRKSLYEWLIERRNLDGAGALHFNTVREMELAQPLGLRAPGVVVPCALDPAEYLGNSTARWTRGGGKKAVLFLGRLNFKKGLDIVAAAFGRVARERDDVRLVVAGPDERGYGTRVHRWLSAEGVRHKAIFAGMLMGEAKLSALRSAYAFLLPSYSENFGIAVIEAMAAGLPVVISNRVNIWEEVAGAGAGIVTACDAREVSTALGWLLDNPDRAREMGERGRALVAAKFSWGVVGEQMRQVYRAVVAGRGAL